MSFTVEPLSPELTFGKTIRGLTSRHIVDELVREELRSYWVQDGVVVFRDGEINPTFQLELSRIFGPLEQHPVKEIQVDGNPDLIVLYSDPKNASIVEIEGEVGGGFLPWHCDLVYNDRINHGGILRAIKPTSHGGVTGFIDRIDAYQRLSDELKARIEGLHVVYRIGPFDEMDYLSRSPVRVVSQPAWLARTLERRDVDFPPVAHPLVFVQPETGRKSLNYSPYFSKYIEELGPEDGHALIQALSDHMNASPAYHHSWTTGEMILWDNWRMLHSVTPVPLDEERIMQRTTIRGDYGLGRKLKIREAAE